MSIWSDAPSSGWPTFDGPSLFGGPSPAEEARAAALDPERIARLGWDDPRAPNGRVLPFDLSRLDEQALLLPGRRAAVYALGDGPGTVRADRTPVILVHGIQGDPKELQPVVDRLKQDGRHQVYVLCYDDYQRRTSANGVDFADELRRLERHVLGPGRNAVIVGHSMGGIVARRALNELAIGPGRGLERFGNVRLVAVDTSWHGYGGPADTGVGGFAMGFVRPFLPDGLEDMRAESSMFRGDPGDRSPAGRMGLLEVRLPPNATVDLVFAAKGDEIHDFTEGEPAALANELVRHYTDGRAIEGTPQLQNFWRAVVTSSAHPAIDRDLRALRDAGRLDGHTAFTVLAQHLPRFQGDHTGVLHEQPGGGFLDHLSHVLGPR